MASETGNLFTNLARTIIGGIRKLHADLVNENPNIPKEASTNLDSEESVPVENQDSHDGVVHSLELEDDSTELDNVFDQTDTNMEDSGLTELHAEKKITPPLKIIRSSPFSGYHLDIDMSSFYSQTVRSLPKYRRDPDPSLHDNRSNYVESNTSNIPCSPRLVQRGWGGNQRQVVTKMLRSYPQPDGSFVCPIRQPPETSSTNTDVPPPLPVKARDRQYAKVTVQVPYKNSCASAHGSPYQSSAANGQRIRSISHKPTNTVMSNDVYNNKPSYSRTQSYPNNANIQHPNVNSATRIALNRDLSIQPLATRPTSKPQVQHAHPTQSYEYHQGYQYRNTTPDHSVELGTPLHYARATYVEEPYARINRGGDLVSRSDSQLSNNSEASTSTYTGSMEYPIVTRSDSDTPEREMRHSDSMSSSLEGGLTEDDSKPELYPEQRLELPLRIKPRSQVKMTCFDMLHNAHHVLEFLSHKVDILEQSLQLFTDKIREMSDLAVTTPSGTNIDTEFCICHQIFDTTKLGHGIWKYFCDADKCKFCCHLFEHLANRPSRLCQLSVLDLNLSLILSGALIITGEDNGGLVVLIQAQSPVWLNCDEDCLLDLSNFLEYISSTVRNGQIDVIVDSRHSPDPITQLIMDSLHNAQRNSKGGISEARFIVDRPSHTPKRLLKPLGTAGKTSVVEIDFCSLSECVLKLSPEKLPHQLGGKYDFDADSWIRSYACLEKKVQQHQRAFGEIFQSTHNLSLVPRTIRHAGNVVHQHKNAVDLIDRTKKSLDRSKYTEEGSKYPPDVDDINSCNILRDAEVRQLLDDLNTFMSNTHVFRDVMDSLQSLGQTGREVARLKVLAEQRLTKLYGCQKLWFCIEEITKTLTLLRRAHDLINKHRVISNNLKSAQVQYNNFNKIKSSVMKLLKQGNELLTDSQSVLADVQSPIPWLEQLSSKLQSELSLLTTFLGKTELLVTDTYHCYTTLDQAYDWAVESMKFVSSMNMDNCLTEEGVQVLSTSLTSFIKDHKIIDKKVFDEVSLKAKNLGNKKLIEQCRIARSRCEETKQVLKVRETTIVKAKEEIEATKAKRISLEQLAADTNITPLTSAASSIKQANDDDIWLPQTSSNLPKADAVLVNSPQQHSLAISGNDDTNNNSKRQSTSSKNSTDRTSMHVQVRSVKLEPSHSRTRSEDTGLAIFELPGIPSSESLDTMASSSQEDILSNNGSQSDILSNDGSKSHTVSPIVTEQLKENSMIKRRSFAGFTNSSNSYPNFNNLVKGSNIVQSNVKRFSDEMSEQDEGLVTVDDDSSCTSTHSELSKSVVEKLEELGIEQSHCKKSTKSDADLRDSVITGSSDSFNSFHEDQEVLTEDSGALTKSSSSSNSHDSNNSQHTNVLWSPVPVNSHLMQRKTSHQWQSMSDLRLTETEIRSRRTLAHIMDELIQTEKDYVMALKLVVEKYIPELNREDVPQMLRGNRGVIFGNIEKIYDFHNHYFLKELLACDKEPFMISQCFLAYEKEFMMYALYNKNKPKSDNLMIEHGSVFFRELQTIMGDKMDLSSYLLKPVQRMGKYALILKQILKECPESAAEYQELTAAQDMIKFCLQHGNDLLAMDALKEQGTLLLQEEFTVQKSRHKAAKRHLFLFDDLLVFAKPKKLGDEYGYKTSLKTADLGLTENVGGSGHKFRIWFRKRSRESWTLQAPSAQVKNKWVSTFEKILWNQAIKNRESRLTELSSMGIGSKPSIDLKPSEDNINDRTINTELKQKVTPKRSTPESGGFDKSPFARKKLTNESSKSLSASPLLISRVTFASTSSRPPASIASTSSNHSSTSSSASNQNTNKAYFNVAGDDDVTQSRMPSGLHMTSATALGSSVQKLSTVSEFTVEHDFQATNKSNIDIDSIRRKSAPSAIVITLLEEPLGPHESKVEYATIYTILVELL